MKDYFLWLQEKLSGSLMSEVLLYPDVPARFANGGSLSAVL